MLALYRCCSSCPNFVVLNDLRHCVLTGSGCGPLKDNTWRQGLEPGRNEARKQVVLSTSHFAISAFVPSLTGLNLVWRICTRATLMAVGIVLLKMTQRNRFCGAFTKLRKATVSFVMYLSVSLSLSLHASVRRSVGPSFRTEQLGFHWTDCHEI